MTLAQEIEALNKEAAENTPAEVSLAFQEAIQNWVSSRVDKNTLKIGDKIPPFQLKNSSGELFTSNDLLKQSPTVISFYRGGWCPWCSLELKALQKHLDEIRDLNGTLVAISAELPETSLTTVENNKLSFPVLSDHNLDLARQFGLVIQLPKNIEDMTKNVFGLDFKKINGMESYELPIPATYVVDINHTIQYAFLDPNFMNRAEPTDILEVLKKLA
ncbi:MAG: AhpC/TSA family protein [Ectothiorhodospiraceae bacterium]|nr:AhpC/TSA family protein [Ectothiorhodospiraceae bacterium]